MNIMTNKNYKRGALYERKTQKILEEHFDCFWSTRSAGSKSCVDVISISPRNTYLVQVKSTKSTKERKPKKAECEDMQNLSANKNITALLFVFVHGKMRIYDKMGMRIR